MKKQYIALLLNFICFGILFVIFRYGVGTLLPLSYLPLLLGSAVLASFLAPKFVVHKENGTERIVVKIPFVKSVKKL
ncbi:MAG: hypothetical protein P8L72_02520 [Flavobacteriaceae bacterium]|nr:hypothetical protein [Flavobacteriaceae bacterium]MDG2314246.1 hypothetical protein [Flavobacteriaceae bacterium]